MRRDLALEETWCWVPGFENRYEASTAGRVRSYAGRPGYPVPYILQPSHDHAGYLQVHLQGGAKRGSERLHCVIARTFLGPKPVGLEVRHLDGNLLNNAVANLAYGTHSDNMRDRVKHGNDPQSRKTHCPQGHPYDGDNLAVYRNRRVCRTCHRNSARKAA